MENILIDAEKPKTMEELFVKQFIELQETHASVTELWLDEKEKRKELQKIVDTLKSHATFDNGTVCIIITDCSKEDRDLIVKGLKLKEGEKTHE